MRYRSPPKNRELYTTSAGPNTLVIKVYRTSPDHMQGRHLVSAGNRRLLGNTRLTCRTLSLVYFVLIIFEIISLVRFHSPNQG